MTRRRTQQHLHPRDLVVALALVVVGDAPWTYASLADALRLSPSQVHTSVRRLGQCSLYSPGRGVPLRRNLLELIAHGVRYVFPADVGALGRGVPTASSAPPLATMLPSGGESFVWPSASGEATGHSIGPLIPSVPEIATSNPAMGELLALVDALRVGKPRERAVAIDALTARLAPTP